ncbi:MAG: aminoacyl-tRNA hydrolase [Lachnospiraceae bacterium]|nr:aminoacyl-tRNA hydrolase [Lachnospiraceae bacterium]
MFFRNRREETPTALPNWLIAGLGNPGEKYHGTRHNAGYLALDELIEDYHFPRPDTDKRWKGMLGRGMIEGIPVFLLKPTTYMNLSGESIRAVADFYRIDIQSRLIVISDEIHLHMGKIRVRKKGSAGGHNGLKNIIQQLGTQDFTRIRIGVGESIKEEEENKNDAGAPSGEQLIGFVLGKPAPEDRALFQEGVRLAAKAAVSIMTEGVDAAMNQYNGSSK